MSAYDRRQKSAALTALAAQAGAGIGSGGPMGAWNQNMANMASSTAQAAAEKEAQKEAEKAEKQKKGGSIGGMAGSIIGSVLGGPVGAAIGGTVGSAGGQAIGGGRVDVGSALGQGAMAGISGVAGNMLPPLGGAGAGASNAVGTAAQTTTQAAGGQAASNATMKAAVDAVTNGGGKAALQEAALTSAQGMGQAAAQGAGAGVGQAVSPLVQTGYTGGGTATPVGGNRGSGLFGFLSTPDSMQQMGNQLYGTMATNMFTGVTGMDGMFDPSVPTVSTYRRNPKNGMALEPVYPTFYR